MSRTILYATEERPVSSTHMPAIELTEADIIALAAFLAAQQ